MVLFSHKDTGSDDGIRYILGNADRAPCNFFYRFEQQILLLVLIWQMPFLWDLCHEENFCRKY